MKYYGIKTPEHKNTPSYIWWITDNEFSSWRNFFTYPSKEDTLNPHRAPLTDAIEAYKSIGYKCVELEVTEK